MFEYILFDLDGTLTDPKIGITSSVQYALRLRNTASGLIIRGFMRMRCMQELT